MQGVELEDLDTRVEIARGIGAGGLGRGGAASLANGTRATKAVGDVEIWGAGGGEVVLEALLVELLCSCVGQQ